MEEVKQTSKYSVRIQYSLFKEKYKRKIKEKTAYVIQLAMKNLKNVSK